MYDSTTYMNVMLTKVRVRTKDTCFTGESQGVGHHSEGVGVVAEIESTTRSYCRCLSDLHSDIRHHTAITTCSSDGVVQNTLTSI